MKLLENFIERTLVKSPILLQLAVAVESLAYEVHHLAEVVVALSETVKFHHEVLQELHSRQGTVMKAVKSNSLDMNMPDIQGDNKSQKSN